MFLPVSVAEFTEQLLTRFRPIIREEIIAERTAELMQKFISQKEACEMFQPKISRVTLNKWCNDGLLKDYRLGARIYLKYGEVLQAAKHLSRYKKSPQGTASQA